MSLYDLADAFSSLEVTEEHKTTVSPKQPEASKEQDNAASWVDVMDIHPSKRKELGMKVLGEDVVVVRELCKEYTLPGRQEKVKALKSINLSPESDFYPIKKGEFVMIRGPSGGGKTTLLNILGTTDMPTGGSVEIFGERVDANSKDTFLADLRLRRIGFVFQTFNLLATMSAFENVELPMTVLDKLPKAEIRQRALDLLTVVGLQDRAQHLPSELSGGEQQRTTIARALSNRPALLLLDEPTGDLDTRNTIDIMDLLLKINIEHKTTCIMVTHNPDLECYADRILYVEDGTFKKQAINSQQMRLDYESYLEYINETHKRSLAQSLELLNK